jgi:hypothetical protein
MHASISSNAIAAFFLRRTGTLSERPRSRYDDARRNPDLINKNPRIIGGTKMMATTELLPMTELTAGELDAVAGGQANAIATGLIAVGAAIGDIVVSAINGNNVTLTNIANNNHVNVGVGAAVAILGGAGAFGVLKKL